MLEVPVLQKFDADGPIGEINQAGLAGRRDVIAGHWAGFPVNLTGYSKRREALVKAESIFR